MRLNSSQLILNVTNNKTNNRFVIFFPEKNCSLLPCSLSQTAGLANVITTASQNYAVIAVEQ